MSCFSLAICAIVPNFVSLASIYLASAIPWSTILAWVADTLHRVICQPTIALAPTKWIALVLPVTLWPQTSLVHPPDKPDNPDHSATRHQRRHFSRILKKSPPRFHSGIRANKLQPYYPLRLRQRGNIATLAPTVTQHDDFCSCNSQGPRTTPPSVSRRQAPSFSSPRTVATDHWPKGR